MHELLNDPNTLEVDCPHCKGFGTILLTAKDLAKELYNKKKWYELFWDIGKNEKTWLEGERECFGCKIQTLQAFERRKLVRIIDANKVFPKIELRYLGRKVLEVLKIRKELK